MLLCLLGGTAQSLPLATRNNVKTSKRIVYTIQHLVLKQSRMLHQTTIRSLTVEKMDEMAVDLQVKKAGSKRSNSSKSKNRGGKNAKKVVTQSQYLSSSSQDEERRSKNTVGERDFVKVKRVEKQEPEMFKPYNEEVVHNEERRRIQSVTDETQEKQEEEDVTFEIHLSTETYLLIGAK